MTYYSDNRITFQEARKEVKEYVADYSETRTFVTAAEVCRKRGIDPTQHNQHRVHKALAEEFDRADKWSSSPQKFKVEDE